MIRYECGWNETLIGESAPAMNEAPNGEWVRVEEVQQMAIDAARYRYLRDNPIQLRAIDGNAAWCGQMTAEQFDAHTDIARGGA